MSFVRSLESAALRIRARTASQRKRWKELQRQNCVSVDAYLILSAELKLSEIVISNEDELHIEESWGRRVSGKAFLSLQHSDSD